MMMPIIRKYNPSEEMDRQIMEAMATTKRELERKAKKLNNKIKADAKRK